MVAIPMMSVSMSMMFPLVLAVMSNVRNKVTARMPSMHHIRRRSMTHGVASRVAMWNVGSMTTWIWVC